MRPIVTLTTDFGLSDSFVGAVKAVLLSRCRDLQIVDITHDVPPQNVLVGALRLASAARYFPPGTVHLAVVDPGVGSARRAVAISAGGHYFVGPDNGVFTFALPGDRRDRRIVELTNSALWLERPSNTFHGRDIFAPVAAHLACGGSLDVLGTAVASVVEIALPVPDRAAQSVVGIVFDVDRFGNLITNVRPDDYEGWTVLSLRVGPIQVDGLSSFYDPARQFVAVVDSDGWLEIAAPGANASRRLAVDVGDVVAVQLGVAAGTET